MAGHSHWAQVKHKKAIVDKKRSQLIAKLINAILIAAKENPDPQNNPKLRNAIERAKDFGVSQETIERNIKKAQGQLEDVKLEEILLEIYTPFGVGLIAKGLTDNKNRTISEIKHILNKYESKLAEPGSVLWMFEEKGVIEIDKNLLSDEILVELQDYLEDFDEKDDKIILYTSINNLYKLKEILENKNINVLSTEIQLIPKTYVNIENNKEVLNKINDLIEELLEHQDIHEVYSNIK
ncbi:MAG: YebC/PmpR family DNA-binding transcriptional regulator [Candidatus Aenigmatarchaeota archaeon]